MGPASRVPAFEAFRAFPEGLEGLSAGAAETIRDPSHREPQHKGKAFMPLYEHVYLARQDLSAQQVEELTTQLSGVIGQMGGKVTKNEYWGLKSLTYRIRKNRKAHMTLLNVEAPAAALNEIERQERLNEDVLRYLTIRVEEHEEGPSAMMRKSDRDRDDRGPRGGGFRDRDRGDRGDRRPRDGGSSDDSGSQGES